MAVISLIPLILKALSESNHLGSPNGVGNISEQRTWTKGVRAIEPGQLLNEATSDYRQNNFGIEIYPHRGLLFDSMGKFAESITPALRIIGLGKALETSRCGFAYGLRKAILNLT